MVLVEPNAKPKTNIMAEKRFMSDQIVEHLPIIGLIGNLEKDKNLCFHYGFNEMRLLSHAATTRNRKTIIRNTYLTKKKV
jgi:hypothetical protein